MATLATLIETLGPPIVEVAAAPRGLDVAVNRVVIHDPADRPDLGAGDIVLAVGLTTSREVEALLELVGSSSGAAVVVKGKPKDAAVSRADSVSVALLNVPQGIAWAQVVLLVSSILASTRLSETSDNLAGVASGDLFAIADVISDMIEAPITIEDPQSRVIAFSSRQEGADAPRIASILGRRVPERYLKRINELRLFQRLNEEPGPIYIADIAPEVTPREAIAIRAGDVVMGYISAAVERPLDATQEASLIDAASFVALHMLRHRVVSDLHGGLHAELVGAVVQGGALAPPAARRLGLTGTAFRVVAVSVEPRSSGSEIDLELPLIRCRDLLTMHLSSTHRRAPVAVLGGAVYAVLPVSEQPGPALAAAREVLSRFVERASSILRFDVLVGIGGQAASAVEIPRSRTEADQTVRVLRESGGETRIAEIGEVRLSALLLQFADEHRDNLALTAGPLQRLRDHDRQHRTAYVETLRAYLNAFGDADVVGRALGVHSNTVRYRMRQLPAIADIHLERPDERLALMLQFQLLSSLTEAPPR